MGFRFRKSIRILPGVRLNLNKSGISTSIGAPGATVNISKRGTRGTVGLPGTGISYSLKLDQNRRLMEPGAAPQKGVSTAVVLGWAFVLVCFLVILSMLAIWTR